MTYYYVTADWSTIVPEGDERAAYGVQAKDLKRLGLTPPDGSAAEDTPEPEVLASANLLPVEPVAEAEPAAEPEAEAPVPAPEPEAKEAPKPTDKAARKPATKTRKEP